MGDNQSELFGISQARERAEEVRQPQQEQVLQVLLAAYPHPISHAEICQRIGSNRASHRIKELVDEGWQIEGAAVLPLDEDSQTQLYRLVSTQLSHPLHKHVGFTIRWTQEVGLVISRHRDCNGVIPTARLKLLAARLQALIEDDLRDLLPQSRTAPPAAPDRD